MVHILKTFYLQRMKCLYQKDRFIIQKTMAQLLNNLIKLISLQLVHLIMDLGERQITITEILQTVWK